MPAVHMNDAYGSAAEPSRPIWKRHFDTSEFSDNQNLFDTNALPQRNSQQGQDNSATQNASYEGFSMGIKGQSRKTKRTLRWRKMQKPSTKPTNPEEDPYSRATSTSASSAFDYQHTPSCIPKNETADNLFSPSEPPPSPHVKMTPTSQPPPAPPSFTPFAFSTPDSSPVPAPPVASVWNELPTSSFHIGVPPASSKGRGKRPDEIRRRIRKERSASTEFPNHEGRAASGRETGPLPFDIPLPPSPTGQDKKRVDDWVDAFNHIHIVDPPSISPKSVPADLTPSPDELDRRFCAQHTIHPPPMSMHLSVMRCWVCLVEFVAAVDRVVYCVGCSIARNMCSLNACTHPLATIRRVAKAASTSAKPKGRPQACPVPPPPPPQWVGLKKKGGEAYSNGDFVLSIDLYSSALEDLDRQLLKAPCADLRAEKAKVLSNRAAAFMMIDKIQEALQDCVAAIDCDGSYLRAHLRLAKCHLLVGNTKSARASYRQVDVMLRGMDYRHHPHLQNYHTQWHEGHLATRLLESLNRQTKRHEDGKDLKAALRTTEEAMAIALASRELRVRKMKLLVQLRAYDLAEDFCNALVRNGALSGVHALGIEMAVLYVRALHYHDKTNEANAILQQLLKVAPTSVDILNVKNLWEVMTDLRSAANSAFKGGDYTSAVLLYTKALTLDVDNHTYNATILGNRAAAHMALKLHAKAIEDCNLALGHHPMYYKVLLRRARCFYTLKHYKESLADFDEYMAKAALTPIEQKDIGRERDQVKNDWDKARRPPSPNYSQSWDDFDDFDTYHSYSAFGGYRQHDNQRSDRSRQNKPKVHKSRQQQYGHHSNYQRSHAKPPTPRYVSPGPTHYDVLRVTATATLDEIKKSYRKLALMYHPDKAKSVEDGELFKGMSAAYAVLSDVHLKAAYDKELRYGSY